MNFFRSIYFFVVLGVLTGSMLLLTGLLIVEYRFFVRELDELTQLKQEYDNYLLLFKRMMLQEENQDSDKDEQAEIIEKKKNKALACTPSTSLRAGGAYSEQVEDNFLLVNRDQSYLQKAAQSLSQQYKLHDAVMRMYTDSGQEQTKGGSKKNKMFPGKRKRGKKSLRQLTLTREFGSEAQDVAHEMNFAWPIEKKLFWLSYGFGPRKHPNGKWEYHRGIDLAAPQGTPVASAAAGVVVQAGYAGGYGNVVVVAHNKKFATRYAHLSKILVSLGDELCAGDILGKVGATGNVRGKNGSHLHFEIMVYGKRVNPFYFLA